MDRPRPRAPAHDRNDRNRAALLIIDMINCFDFEGGEEVERRAQRAAERILDLRRQVDGRCWPTIYVNDNFGQWHSDSSVLVETAIREGNRIAEMLRPTKADYFVIKPQFSGFYATNLPVLLPKLGVGRLILTGVATDICVLFTAADAHMRDYALWVPSDSVAAEDEDRQRWALAVMANSMGAETAPAAELTLAGWLSQMAQ